MTLPPAASVVTPDRLTWELRLINDVARVLSSSLDASDVLQQGLTLIADACGVRWAVLRLRPLDGGPLTVRAVHGAPVDLVSAVQARQDAWPSDAVLTTLQPMRRDDATDVDLGDLRSQFPAASVLSVPVVAGSEALGIITLIADAPRHFDDADERLLTTIGRQFGMAVANSQLYERVHRAKVQWERTFDAISDPIALFDAGGRTLRTNAALADLRGWRIRETQARTCTDVGLCGGGCPDCLVGRALREGRRLSREVTTGDGRVFAVTTLPVPDAGGSVVLFAREMTAERTRERRLRALSRELSATNAEMAATLERLQSTQAQLVEAGKLSALGLLAAGVAHEINNPLTSIIGFAQLVRDAVASSAEASDGLLEDVSRIQSEADRAARIVRSLLTFSRRQAAERLGQDVRSLIEQVLALRAHDLRLNGIDVTVACRDTLPMVHVDGHQIQQALLNLVLNAEHAMRDAEVRRLRIEAEAEPGCSAVLLRVRDTGHGIEAAHVARVFDPFFTTRQVGEGTGLGLSIVYGIVRDHGGQIWVESALRKGTTFTIRLPVRDPGAEQVPALVAHAEPVTRDFLAAVLSGWGYPVRVAQTPGEALQSLAEDNLALLLVDRSVAEGDPESWRERWARVRERTALILLERGGDDAGARAMRDEAAAWLSEPYDLHALREALQTVRRRQPLAPRPRPR